MQQLEDFEKKWEEQYKSANKNIELFNTSKTSALTTEQKQFFAKSFYHARGHFYKFLWYMGSFATSEASKQIILDNIREEFGGKLNSHEQLYWEFAKSLGAEISDEIINDTNNLAFIKEFNKGHIDWLMTHDWDHKWAAFSAYEKLDNVDYENLYQLAVSFGLRGRPLIFFEVHRKVEHYEHTSSLLNDIWNRNPNAVIEAFNFIGEHQTLLWKNLSDAIFQK